MTNLKFTNKYYRKLKIDIHYKTIDKISYNNEDEKKDGNDNNKEDKNKAKVKIEGMLYFHLFLKKRIKVIQ